MAKKARYIRCSWQQSCLAAKITHPQKIQRLNDVWDRANEAYPRIMWGSWVDHTATHILNVLRNLDRLIPDYVYKEIEETEAFVLIAATLLHDIGMIPEQNRPRTLRYFADLRCTHGERGVEITRKHFSDLLRLEEGDMTVPICEIVQNHHGQFQPQPRVNFPHLSGDALWVRLADELDFGPHRAPNWLLDYVRPDKEQLCHWLNHNRIDEPAIDLDLLRIQITGTVESEAFIRKLRAEFETAQRQEVQKGFLSRGLKKPVHNRTFLIWDCTDREIRPGEDSKEIDARPAVFSNEQFLAGARHLYNLGRYEMARKYFEDGLDRLTGRWSAMPATPYFYHYLKTLNALGEHEKAIRVAVEYRDTRFSSEIKAAVAASNGLAYWKTYKFGRARDSLKKAIGAYKRLSRKDIKHKINEADAWVLHGITCLEEIRASKRLKSGEALIRGIENGIKNAQKLFSEYETEKPDVSESHYKGRYWGLRAFFSLLQIESKRNTNAKAWTEALRFAQRAYGDTKQAHRNPFGAMCGKYCAAAVNFHKHQNCSGKSAKRRALLNSAELIRDVREVYDELFSSKKRTFRLWPKIHRLFVLIREELPKGSELRKRLSGFYGSDEPTDEIEIYTPLH